jgi:hypothetical protein
MGQSVREELTDTIVEKASVAGTFAGLGSVIDTQEMVDMGGLNSENLVPDLFCLLLPRIGSLKSFQRGRA